MGSTLCFSGCGATVRYRNSLCAACRNKGVALPVEPFVRMPPTIPEAMVAEFAPHLSPPPVPELAPGEVELSDDEVRRVVDRAVRMLGVELRRMQPLAGTTSEDGISVVLEAIALATKPLAGLVELKLKLKPKKSSAITHEDEVELFLAWLHALPKALQMSVVDKVLFDYRRLQAVP
jgi:hypothetical protein